jgi:hypothetical protein
MLFCLALIFSDAQDSISQDKWWKDKKYKNESAKAKYELCKKTLVDVGNGFSYGNIGPISQYFSSLIYLDIFGNEKGFYSPSQAEIILTNFMDNFSIETFRYKSSSRYSTYASAKGVYEYRKGSTRSSLSATVSLKFKDRIWYIDQIVIN